VETEGHDTQRRVASLRANLASGEHLRFDDEMVPYVDGHLDADAKRAVESHLANCEVCRREIDDLRKFAAAPRRFRPAVIAALAAAAAIVIGFTVLMQRPEPRVVTHAQPLAVTLRDGGRVIGIDRNGTFRGIGVKGDVAQRAAALISHPDLALPAALAGLVSAPGQLRGAATSPEVAVVSPVGVAVVDARPQFVWRGESNAAYQVIVVDDAGNELHGETRTDHWTPPADLARGRTYTWQVSTTIGGRRVIAPSPPEPPALFRLVDQNTADAVAAAHSHLIAGMLAYDAGALADARREFEQLAAANPDSPIPPKLIASCNRALKR
jgi:anti-sigma factor RsiW